MKTFRIPYSYSNSVTVSRTEYYRGTMEVEAESLEEAIELAREDPNMDDGEFYDSNDDDYNDSRYNDDSFEVNEKKAEKFAEEDGNLETPEEKKARLAQINNENI